MINFDKYKTLISILKLSSNFGAIFTFKSPFQYANDNADGWFMGVTPNLVVGCWVGGDDRDIHFGSMAFGQGAKASLPIFGRFMRKVYDNNRKNNNNKQKKKEQKEKGKKGKKK